MGSDYKVVNFIPISIQSFHGLTGINVKDEVHCFGDKGSRRHDACIGEEIPNGLVDAQDGFTRWRRPMLFGKAMASYAQKSSEPMSPAQHVSALGVELMVAITRQLSCVEIADLEEIQYESTKGAYPGEPAFVDTQRHCGSFFPSPSGLIYKAWAAINLEKAQASWGERVQRKMDRQSAVVDDVGTEIQGILQEPSPDLETRLAAVEALRSGVIYTVGAMGWDLIAYPGELAMARAQIDAILGQATLDQSDIYNTALLHAADLVLDGANEERTVYNGGYVKYKAAPKWKEAVAYVDRIKLGSVDLSPLKVLFASTQALCEADNDGDKRRMLSQAAGAYGSLVEKLKAGEIPLHMRLVLEHLLGKFPMLLGTGAPRDMAPNEAFNIVELGDPDKQETPDAEKASPPSTFEKWRDTVKQWGRSQCGVPYDMGPKSKAKPGCLNIS